MMLHYWTASDNPASRQLQVIDWLDALDEFSPLVVERACRRWVDEQGRRPTPAELRKLCAEEKAKLVAPAPALSMTSPDVPPEPFPSLGHYRWLRARADEAKKTFIDSGRPNMAAYREAFRLEDERHFYAYLAAWLKLEWGPDWWRKFNGRKPPIDMIEAAEEFFCTHPTVFQLPERKQWPSWQQAAGAARPQPAIVTPRTVMPDNAETGRRLSEELDRRRAAMAPADLTGALYEELGDEIPF